MADNDGRVPESVVEKIMLFIKDITVQMERMHSGLSADISKELSDVDTALKALVSATSTLASKMDGVSVDTVYVKQQVDKELVGSIKNMVSWIKTVFGVTMIVIAVVTGIAGFIINYNSKTLVEGFKTEQKNIENKFSEEDKKRSEQLNAILNKLNEVTQKK